MRLDEAKIKLPTPINKAEKKQRVSVYTESYKGEYYNIDISKLIPFKNQSRKIFDQKDLEDLASTIRNHGIRQPLTVLPSEAQNGMYEIVSGERRWRAAGLIGLTKVPCIILQDREAAEEIALIENIQRKNLHPLELMNGFQSLMDKGICKNQQEIADKLGISRTIVVETLLLNRLSNKVQDLLLREKIKSRETLRELLKLKEENQIKLINNLLNKKQEKKPTKTKAILPKKHKILSIYLEEEKLCFESLKDIKLTLEQRNMLKDRIQEFLAQIE